MTHDDLPLVPIADADDRQIVHVQGRVVSITVEPRDATAELVAVVNDGSDSLAAVFMGRRDIVGVDAGADISLEGRVIVEDERKMMYNPRYDLHRTVL